ncbi:MBL fold metallo-hydrolase [Halorientalis halophila]|uniref:MBL fold metallo-hydrolase n=1 Tax=Halorientalis halophila TaxID=3108499 RepID=UPI003009E17E
MFTRLTVPTPFQIGPVNAYLAGRTLVDPGPDSEEAWSHLLDALDERNLEPDDIERVVITHPHPDHFGLAHRFRDAGATVVATPDAAAIVSDFEGRFERECEFFTDFFERCGMARSTAETVTGLPEVFLRYAPDVAVDQEVVQGDTLVVHDTVLDVDEVLGHADGECVLSFDADGERQAIVGDHVLLEITPNPFLLPPGEDGERPRVLPAYNRSLDRLRDRDYDRLLPGHRDLIDRPSERIGEIREAHEERTANVKALVDGPTTPVDVMEGLFEDLPVTESFAGMSEAVGHLDVLEDRGEVTLRDRGGVLVYEPQ